MIKMKKFIGVVLRVLAILIGLNGVAGVALSFMGDGADAFVRGAFTLLIAWGLYYLGTRLKHKAVER